MEARAGEAKGRDIGGETLGYDEGGGAEEGKGGGPGRELGITEGGRELSCRFCMLSARESG